MTSSPEATAPLSSPHEITIATACDIRLGEAFRSDPDLAGQTIGINTSAIRDIVTQFNPNPDGKVQELRFIAVPTSNLSPGAGATTTYVKGVAVVEVGVTRPAEPDMAYVIDRHITTVAAGVLLQRQEIDAEDIPYFMGTTITESLHDIQVRTVHELQHVADYSNREVLSSERQFIRQTVSHARKKSIGMAGLAAIGVEVAGLAIASTRPAIVTLSSLVAAATTGRKVWRRESAKASRRLSQESPMEERAYATSSVAASLPHVISIC